VGAFEDGDEKGKVGAYMGTDNGPGERTGLKAFEEVEEINMVVAPGQTHPAIQDAVLSHCENMRYRFALLDSPEVIEKGGVDKLPKPRDSKYGAYYFPWVEVYDPFQGNIYMPPSGYMAGIYARVDGERGVHKAPANEIVRGALGLRYNITKGEQDILNPKGINVIRSFTNRGIRVWGARTISSDASLALHQRAPPVQHGGAVHRERDAVGGVRAQRPQAVERVTRDLSAFLLRLWRQGALFGATPEQAFYVKCDNETNPPEVIDAGQLVVEIGMCPVKPAEFVIFRIGQMPAGGEVSE